MKQAALIVTILAGALSPAFSDPQVLTCGQNARCAETYKNYVALICQRSGGADAGCVENYKTYYGAYQFRLGQRCLDSSENDRQEGRCPENFTALTKEGPTAFPSEADWAGWGAEKILNLKGDYDKLYKLRSAVFNAYKTAYNRSAILYKDLAQGPLTADGLENALKKDANVGGIDTKSGKMSRFTVKDAIFVYLGKPYVDFLIGPDGKGGKWGFLKNWDGSETFTYQKLGVHDVFDDKAWDKIKQQRNLKQGLEQAWKRWKKDAEGLEAVRKGRKYIDDAEAQAVTEVPSVNVSPESPAPPPPAWKAGGSGRAAYGPGVQKIIQQQIDVQNNVDVQTAFRYDPQRINVPGLITPQTPACTLQSPPADVISGKCAVERRVVPGCTWRNLKSDYGLKCELLPRCESFLSLGKRCAGFGDPARGETSPQTGEVSDPLKLAPKLFDEKGALKSLEGSSGGRWDVLTADLLAAEKNLAGAPKDGEAAKLRERVKAQLARRVKLIQADDQSQKCEKKPFPRRSANMKAFIDANGLTQFPEKENKCGAGGQGQKDLKEDPKPDPKPLSFAMPPAGWEGSDGTDKAPYDWGQEIKDKKTGRVLEVDWKTGAYFKILAGPGMDADQNGYTVAVGSHFEYRRSSNGSGGCAVSSDKPLTVDRATGLSGSWRMEPCPGQ